MAEKVRKLSEQSTGAAGESKGLITNILNESQKAVDMMALSSKEAEANTLVVQEVDQSFGQIIDAVEGLTEEMSTGIQNVTAATEEQTAVVEELASSVEQLNKLSLELNGLVEKFKI